jgi:transcriptional regulator with XRE-family HTH domain
MSSEKIHWRYQAALTPLFGPERGPRLAKARMKMGLSQAELGHRLGVSQSVVSSIELGRTRVAEFTLAQFLAALGTGANYVLTGAGKEIYEAPGVKIKFWHKRLNIKSDTGDDAKG